MHAAEEEVLLAPLADGLIELDLRPRADLLGDVALEEEPILLPVDAARRDGALEVHPLKEDVSDHLRHRGEDPHAPRRAQREARAAALEDDRGRHVRDRALVRADRIGMAGGALTVGDVVVEKNAVPLRDDAAPEEMADRLADRAQ